MCVCVQNICNNSRQSEQMKPATAQKLQRASQLVGSLVSWCVGSTYGSTAIMYTVIGVVVVTFISYFSATQLGLLLCTLLFAVIHLIVGWRLLLLSFLCVYLALFAYLWIFHFFLPSQLAFLTIKCCCYTLL